jgi:hypothetical protein
MIQSRINPIQLGAIPSRDTPDFWLLSRPGPLEMTIARAEGDDLFTVAVRIATLLPDAQAYQLAAALMLNRDTRSLDGGAVAYNVHDDSFLYCKAIDARTLSLSAFGAQVDAGFATARTLRELMLHAQEDVSPPPVSARRVPAMGMPV